MDSATKCNSIHERLAWRICMSISLIHIHQGNSVSTSQPIAISFCFLSLSLQTICRARGARFNRIARFSFCLCHSFSIIHLAATRFTSETDYNCHRMCVRVRVHISFSSTIWKNQNHTSIDNIKSVLIPFSFVFSLSIVCIYLDIAFNWRERNISYRWSYIRWRKKRFVRDYLLIRSVFIVYWIKNYCILFEVKSPRSYAYHQLCKLIWIAHINTTVFLPNSMN